VVELACLLDVSLDYLFDDAIPIDSPVRSVALTPDELTIVKLARRLGAERAIDRLLGVEAAGSPAGVEEGSAGNSESPDPRREA